MAVIGKAAGADRQDRGRPRGCQTGPTVGVGTVHPQRKLGTKCICARDVGECRCRNGVWRNLGSHEKRAKQGASDGHQRQGRPGKGLLVSERHRKAVTGQKKGMHGGACGSFGWRDFRHGGRWGEVTVVTGGHWRKDAEMACKQQQRCAVLHACLWREGT